jgi:hypothetical protein
MKTIRSGFLLAQKFSFNAIGSAITGEIIVKETQ